MEQVKIKHSIAAQCHPKIREHRVNIFKAIFKPSASQYLFFVANPKLRKSIELVGASLMSWAFEKNWGFKTLLFLSVAI